MTKIEIAKIMIANGYQFGGEVSGNVVNEYSQYADVAYYDKYLAFKKDDEYLFVNIEIGALGRRIIRIFPNGKTRTYAINNF